MIIKCVSSVCPIISRLGVLVSNGKDCNERKSDRMDIVRNNLTLVAQARVAPEQMRLLGWNVAPEDLKQIPEHWLSYQEPEASLHYLLALLYIAFTFFSLTGNGLVIWVFTA